jgi:hypothetical protein
MIHRRRYFGTRAGDQRRKVSAPGDVMTTDSNGITGSSVGQTATSQLASLPLARAYIDTVREEIGSLGMQQLIGALDGLNRAYHEFPELELERPRRDLSEGLRSAAQKLPESGAIPLLMHILAFEPSSLSAMTLLFHKIAERDGWQSLLPILNSLNSAANVPWHKIEPVVHLLRNCGEEGSGPQEITEILETWSLTKENTAGDFRDILEGLLSAERPGGTDRGAPAEAAQSARRRPSEPAAGRNDRGSRDGLLATAQRLRAAPPPQRASRQPSLAWPSGPISFDEFLLQWPCEVDLPIDLDDQAFIEEAYQAILLRGPDVAELNQYLRLLQNNVVSKPWVIEDLLASEELHALERRVRVNWGGCVITEPARPADAAMPAVTWPRRTAA